MTTRSPLRAAIAAFAGLTISAAMGAAEIVVTDGGDDLHSTGCAATGKPPCTLRDAITRANARPGADRVTFAVGSGPVTIQLTSPLPPITDPLTLDATTQPGFETVPVVEIDGTGAGEDAAGLQIRAGSSTVRGLALGRFRAGALAAIVLTEKGGNVLEGNFVGTDPTGDTARANRGHGVLVRSDENTIQRNVVSGNTGDGIRIQGARNLVLGNFVGTDAPGGKALGNHGDGIACSGGNTIGGGAPGSGNVVSGNGGVGISAGPTDTILGNFVGTDAAGTAPIANARGGIKGGGRIGTAEGVKPGGPCSGGCNLVSGNGGAGIAPSAGASVAGNFVSTDVSGTEALGNSGAGISIGVARATVGGASDSLRNIVSGNGGPGIDLAFDADSTQVMGNVIGADASGAVGIGNASGVTLRDGARRNRIGGNFSTEGNRIAYNSGPGVLIAFSAGTGNAVLGNSIVDNGALGIDVGGDGVTTNGTSASPAGPSAPSNFPVLTSATPFSVEGTLDAAPSTAYMLEFFASPACDPSGYGQGQTLIAITTLSTDGGGHADFGVSLTAPPGQNVTATATATAPAGNTSEFSACAPVEGEVEEGETPQ